MPDEADTQESDKVIRIQIDRVHYEVDRHRMTGAELRLLANPPIGTDRDLFEVVQHVDTKIEWDASVHLRQGTRFFTAPAHINPGAGLGRSAR